MSILQNAFRLTANQRKALMVLTCVWAVSANRVEAAQAATGTILTPAQASLAQVQELNSDNQSFVVPPTYMGSLPSVADAATRYTMTTTLTAYSSTVSQCDDSPFITADGTHVADGIVAANFLPFGTRVRIPALFGDKVFTVHDRMNARYDNRMDIWMADEKPALQFGIKHNVTIEILK